MTPRNALWRAHARVIVAVAACLLAGALVAPPTQAAGTVTKCNSDAQLVNKIVVGGLVKFNCGTRTIILGGPLAILHDTTIDGGGKITLSGANAHEVFIVTPGNQLTLRRIVLTRGLATIDGGAIYSDHGTVVLDHVTISHSRAVAGSGGAIFSSGPMTIDHSTFDHNAGANAGAIMAFHSQAVVSIRDSTLHHNRATHADQAWGGAILLWDGSSVTIARSELFANTAKAGGAIYVNQAGTTTTLLMRDSTVRDNRAIDPVSDPSPVRGDGGGIANWYGSVTLTRVTVSGNESDGGYGGGGIFNYFFGTLTATDVTLSGNRSGTYGGGIDNHGMAALKNLTIVGNLAPDPGSGLSSDDAGLQLTNVVLSNPGDDCDFNVAPGSSSFNLSSDASCDFGTGNNAALKLGPLDTNGGPTLTHRLLPGSDAIDAGAAVGCPAKDQRGVTRPRGAACDVGAVEFVPCGATPPAPKLASPASGARVATAKVSLDWSGPDCATTFSVTVRRGSTTGSVAFAASGLAASRATTSALTRNRTYYWRATACKSPTHCASSAWRKLSVLP